MKGHETGGGQGRGEVGGTHIIHLLGITGVEELLGALLREHSTRVVHCDVQVSSDLILHTQVSGHQPLSILKPTHQVFFCLGNNVVVLTHDLHGSLGQVQCCAFAHARVSKNFAGSNEVFVPAGVGLLVFWFRNASVCGTVTMPRRLYRALIFAQ